MGSDVGVHVGRAGVDGQQRDLVGIDAVAQAGGAKHVHVVLVDTGRIGRDLAGEPVHGSVLLRERRAVGVLGDRRHRRLVAADVPQEGRVGRRAVRRPARPRRRDGGDLEPAPVHAATHGQVEGVPGPRDLGPAGEGRGVVGEEAPRRPLTLVVLGDVALGDVLSHSGDEHAPILPTRAHEGRQFEPVSAQAP